VRRTSPSSPTESAARLRSLAAILALCLIAAAPAHSPEPQLPFLIVTRDGTTYASPRPPAIKNGYLFLADANDNFFSLPMQQVDWAATRAANRVFPPELLDHWEEGPVRYILDAPQEKEYRALHSDAERAAWISKYWDSLDPTPETFFNEKRFQYWSRVHEATAQFTDSTRPGWKTDRGKIYILLGPPDEIESFPNRSGNDARFDPRFAGDSPGGYPRHTIPPRGVVRWTYRNPPGGRLDPNTMIAFREDPSGEYVLSTEGADYDRIFRDVARSLFSVGDDAHGRMRDFQAGRLTGSQRAQAQAMGGTGGGPGPSTLSLLSDLGKVQDLALVQSWVSEVVSAREYFGVFPVRSDFHFYRSQEGETYAELNLAIERPAAAGGAAGPGAAPGSAPGRKPAAPARPDARPFTLSARLMPRGEPARGIEIGADGFAAAADPQGGWVFQSGAGVPPGTYTLMVGIVDNASGEIGSWREEVEVPDLSGGGLLMSDLVLASRVERLPEHAQGAYKEPFLQGHLRVLPNVAHVYRAGSDLAFYYQVYGAAVDPATGKPALDLLYRFERKEEAGARLVSTPVRLESQNESSQGFSFPLSGWPAGAYRLTVEVTDRASGRRAARSVEFTVEGG
jgi:GWxTD domain-containing protein